MTVADRWHKSRPSDDKSPCHEHDKVPTVNHGRGARWRAHYRDAAGKEHAKHFTRKVDASTWLDAETSKLVTGTWTHPKTARTTVTEWCDTWLTGYGTRRPSTVRQAGIHIAQIKKAFGDLPLSEVRPSAVKSWTAQLRAEGLAQSYVHACHRRLSQIMSDAVHDNLLPRNPCSRRTSPRAGTQRPYVATTEQVLALLDAFPEHLRPAVLLGAFAGLRVGEACGLRVGDVDFMRGVVTPAVQYPAEPLKTEASQWPVPIPSELALELASYVKRFGGGWLVTNAVGGQVSPRSVDRAMQVARGKVPGVPEGFRHQDLRHYYVSLLISAGCDIKTVQARVRHGNATTTLNVYGHMFPDADESTRAAVAAVLADYLRTAGVRDGS